MTSKLKILKVFLIATLTLLTLSACNVKTATEPRSANVEAGGQHLMITFDENTFSSGIIESDNGEYTFQYEANSNGLKFAVVYPDGYAYSQVEKNGGIAMPVDYDSSEREAKGYVDGLSLAWAVDSAADNARGKKSHGGASPLLAILLIGCGAWNLFAPKSAWWLAYGWKYKNAEPSDIVLTLFGVLGLLLLVGGVICLIASF